MADIELLHPITSNEEGKKPWILVFVLQKLKIKNMIIEPNNNKIFLCLSQSEKIMIKIIGLQDCQMLMLSKFLFLDLLSICKLIIPTIS